MRLDDRDIDAIKEAVARWFGPEASVYLFGSRVDDRRRGGDIDLYVRTGISAEAANRAKMLAIADIQLAIGDQKVDMVVSPFVREGDLVMREIEREAVPL